MSIFKLIKVGIWKICIFLFYLTKKKTTFSIIRTLIGFYHARYLSRKWYYPYLLIYGVFLIIITLPSYRINVGAHFPSSTMAVL